MILPTTECTECEIGARYLPSVSVNSWQKFIRLLAISLVRMLDIYTELMAMTIF